MRKAPKSNQVKSLTATGEQLASLIASGGLRLLALGRGSCDGGGCREVWTRGGSKSTNGGGWTLGVLGEGDDGG